MKCGTKDLLPTSLFYTLLHLGLGLTLALIVGGYPFLRKLGSVRRSLAMTPKRFGGAGSKPDPSDPDWGGGGGWGQSN